MPKLIALGINQVKTQLKSRSLSGNAHFNLKVGFRAPYAVKQHEDLTLNHPNGGQAKFLEQPARQYRREMRDIAKQYLSGKKRSLEDATRAMGNFLLEKAKELVPVDTGFLRESGFVEIG